MGTASLRAFQLFAVYCFLLGQSSLAQDSTTISCLVFGNDSEIVPVDFKKLGEVFKELPSRVKRQTSAILTQDQKSIFSQVANDLISSSLRYSLAKREREDTNTAEFIEVVQSRLAEMKAVANLMFSLQNATTYNQSLNYFERLLLLADVMAYKVEGEEFSGFFYKDNPYHSEVDSRPREPIKFSDFTNNLEDGSFWERDERFASNGVFIPVYGDLSVVDLNYLVGLGLFPVSISERTLRADGQKLGPFQFANHDKQHAESYIPPVLSEKAQKVWGKLLDWADAEDGATRWLRHVVLFAASHEDSFFRYVLDREDLLTDLKHLDHFNMRFNGALFQIPDRLKRQDYWGIAELKSMEDLEDNFWNQARQLIDEYKSILEAL
ncbi:MAG: hypothetical protein COT74_01530 [Bdellovibrionales bacterium CG10_big_fil_rev_8_21_14_0_10_45_34]|nr:MAG: hypothetical protein COT74_01530 [Bdellovibrionales bacterium CG10_big_fil_rev_8_21_14_0_10_45_34]